MSSKCDFCQKTVYFAEKQTRKGLDYHGSCLQKKILEEKIKRVSLRGGLIKKETITQEQLSVVSNEAQNLTKKGNEQVKEENKKKWQELRKNKQTQTNGNHTRDVNIPLKSVLDKAPTNNHQNGENDHPENCPHDVFSSNQKYFQKTGTNTTGTTEQNGEGPKKRVVVRKVIIKKVIKKTDNSNNNNSTSTNTENKTTVNHEENQTSNSNNSTSTNTTQEDPLERRMRERREQKEKQKLEEQRKKEELELKLQELQNKMNSIPIGVGTVELEDDPIGDDDPIDDEPIGEDDPIDDEPIGDDGEIGDEPIDDNLDDGEGFDDEPIDDIGEDFGDDGEGLSFCPECGNKQSDPTAKFCEDCGNPLELEDV